LLSSIRCPGGVLSPSGTRFRSDHNPVIADLPVSILPVSHSSSSVRLRFRPHYDSRCNWNAFREYFGSVEFSVLQYKLSCIETASANRSYDLT
jgi:hypothetical protein